MTLRCLVLGLALSLSAAEPPVFQTFWRSTFDSAGSDEPTDVKLDAQGNFVIIGQAVGADTGSDGIVMKVNPSGQRIWLRRFDGSISGDDYFASVAVGSGAVSVAGISTVRDSQNALIVANYNTTNGSQNWIKVIPGRHSTSPFVGMDGSGNVYATVGIESDAAQIVRTYKYSPGGQTLWISNMTNSLDVIYGVTTRIPMLVDRDGNCYIGGLTTAVGNDLDCQIIKLAPGGGESWRLATGGSSYDSIPMMTFDPSGNLVFAASSQNETGGFDLLLEKISPNKSRIWQSKLRGASVYKAGSHHPVDLKCDALGNVFLAGSSPGWGGFLSRFSPSGKFEWTTHFPATALSVAPLPNGQSFLSLAGGVAWFETDGTVLLFEEGRPNAVPVADSQGSVFAASSYATDAKDYGLAAEKLKMGRSQFAPKFTTIPKVTTGFAEFSVELVPEVSGSNLVYAWSHNGTPMPGQTNRILFIPELNPDTVGYYSVVATNEFGATSSPDVEVLTLFPMILRQPKSQLFTANGDVAFSALAVGYESQTDLGFMTNYVHYQWQRFNYYAQWFEPTWTNIIGETSSKLLIRNVTPDDAGFRAYNNFGQEVWYSHSYRLVASSVFPEFGYESSPIVSDMVYINRPSESLEEVSDRELTQYYMEGEPWTLANGLRLPPTGGASLSLQSSRFLARADIEGTNLFGVFEDFLPARTRLPKGPHLADSLGNVYAIGETNRLDTSFDWMISKRTAAGDLLWSQTVSSLGRLWDDVADAVVDKHDHIIVTGTGTSATGGRDFLTVSIHKSTGAIRWTASYNDPESIHTKFQGDEASAIQTDSRGFAYVAGVGISQTNAFHLLVSYNTNGLQRFVYKRPWTVGIETPPLLAVDPDGNSVLASSFGLVKVDSNGRQLWEALASSTNPPTFKDVKLDNVGNIFLSGNPSSGMAFVKYDAFGVLINVAGTNSFPETSFAPTAGFALDDFGNAYVPTSGGSTLVQQDILLVKLNSLFLPIWCARVDGRSEGLDYPIGVRVNGDNVFLAGNVMDNNTLQASLTEFRQTPNPVRLRHLNRSQIVRKGTNFTATVLVTGNPTAYIWYRNTNQLNQSSPTLTLPNIDYGDEGYYYLIASDGQNGAVSGGFSIRVAEGPGFVEQPTATNITVGGDLRLAASLRGTQPISLQWLKNGEPVAGATNASLLIPGVDFENRGDYRLVASNEWGTVPSSVATVFVARPDNSRPIVKLSEPVNGVVKRTLNPILLRAAVYDPDGRVTRVLFRVNGAIVGDKTEPFETSWTPPGAGAYTVTAEAFDNLLASSISAEALVIVANDPIITQQPTTTLTLDENEDLTLTADATGTPPPKYQWRLNGANIPGATNRTYFVGGAQVRHSGKYAVLVANQGAAKLSAATEVLIRTDSVVFKDKLADALTITNSQFTARGNNVGATFDLASGEKPHAFRKGGASVWLRWKATESGVLSIHTRGSAIDTLLAVYKGTDFSNLSRIVSDDERGGFHCSAIRFNAVKEQIYLFAIDGYKGQTGNIVLSWSLDSSARELPVINVEPVSVSSVITNAVPQFTPQVVSALNLRYQWYHNGYPIPGATSTNLTFSSLSKINLGTYVLRISNDDGSVESLSAELELGSLAGLPTQDRAEDLNPLPQGDGTALAGGGYPTIHPGIPFQKFFNTAGATTDSDEPIIGDGGGASKWFMVTASSNGTLVADTIGSQYTTTLTLHDGSNFETLPVLANGSPLPDGSSRVQYEAIANRSYVMRVDGPEGTVTLNVTLGTPPILNVAPLDRIVGVGSNVVLTAALSPGSPVATLQWFLNGVSLPGKTSLELPISNFNPAQVGMYELEARNPLASVKKTVAYLELERETKFSPLIKNVNGTQLRIEGNNQTYFIDATTNLMIISSNTIWSSNIFNGRAENGALIFTEPPIPGVPHRFYRARK